MILGSVGKPDLASSGPFSACLHPAVSTMKRTLPASPSLSGEKNTRSRADDGVFRKSLVLKRCLTAVFPAAIAWVGIALVREQSLSGVYQAPVAISGIVLSAVSLVSAFVMPLLAAKLSGDLDGALSRRRGLSIVWAIIALLALGQGARLSIFMADIDQEWASAFPPSEHVVHHQCLAGYVRAVEMSRQGEANLWDPNHYPSAAGLPEPPESSVEELGPYLGDRYLYPPPFILGPRGLLAITNSFMDIRILVFGINALGLFAVPFLLACWIGAREGDRKSVV